MESSIDAVLDRSSEIKPKTHYSGTITKIVLAGAVVDLGLETPGYLHISQIPAETPNQPVKRVDEVLKEGERVDVWVRRVKSDRIELTMIKPLDYEWRELKPGMVVKGKVVKIEKFGAFVDIGAERPGLVHISEMAHGYVRVTEDVAKEGDEIEAQILDVDRRKKQIKLSLKALQPEPALEEVIAAAKPVEQANQERPARRRSPRQKQHNDASLSVSQANLAELEKNNSPEPDPTAMEIALREAMERAKNRKNTVVDKKKSAVKSVSKTQEDILTRTLESKQQNP